MKIIAAIVLPLCIAIGTAELLCRLGLESYLDQKVAVYQSNIRSFDRLEPLPDYQRLQRFTGQGGCRKCLIPI